MKFHANGYPIESRKQREARQKKEAQAQKDLEIGIHIARNFDVSVIPDDRKDHTPNMTYRGCTRG